MKTAPTEQQLLKVLELLEPQDSKLLKLRFGISQDGPKSLEQLATVYNITRDQMHKELLRVERLAQKELSDLDY